MARFNDDDFIGLEFEKAEKLGRDRRFKGIKVPIRNMERSERCFEHGTRAVERREEATAIKLLRD
jgi:hypothetical protein